MKRIALAWVLLCCAPALAGGPIWRQATLTELRQIIPARAPVGKERIETEFRAASGITDGRRYVAGVFMIVTGYEAEGKYTHFIITQVPLRVGELQLQPGEYVFGSKRVDSEVVEVKFYEAASERFLGTVVAKLDTRRTGVRQFYISPAAYGSGKGFIQFGRFVFEYKLSQ
ncbi:MAG TPA: hypothetical protein VKA60_18635 [Blastocatellia bacterium]|nr:hypothetical protein [Blastocatellia bacterium]